MDSISLPLELLHTLPSPTGPIRAWQSRPHSTKPLLATALTDKSVTIHSLTNFTLLSTIAGGHKRSVRTVAWKDYGDSNKKPRLDGEEEEEEAGGRGKQDEVLLATGSFDANVGIWRHNHHLNPDEAGEDNEEWQFTTLLTGPDSEIKSIQFSPPTYSSNLLATSSRDKSVWVWEEVEDDEWETIAVLSEHTGDVKCVSWAKDREVLASAAYDDTIRLWRDVEEEGDWGCIGVLTGHEGTVWGISWEDITTTNKPTSVEGARLMSCSDDLTIRIWHRIIPESERQRLRDRDERNAPASQKKLPSIIRPPSSMEMWEEETKLPAVHVRSIYAVDWSSKTGLVVSCAGDGTIAVCKEIQLDEDVTMSNADEDDETNMKATAKTKWEVVAIVEGAHDEYEINHVCWAERRDKEKRWDGEEMVVSTGDDGAVKLWVLPRGIVQEG